jgi:KUP system potassium uptake protein
MVALVAVVVWRYNSLVVLLIWLPFVTLDGLYLSAASTKIPDGAWFTLLLAVLLSFIFVLWRYGKERQWEAEGRGHFDLSSLVIKNNTTSKYYLSDSMGGRELTTIKGIAIFFDKAGDGVPTVYQEFLRKFEALPDIQVLLHLRALSCPYVAEDEKFEIMRTALPNCYRMIVRHGYNDVIITEGLGDLVYAQIKNHILTTALRSQPVEAASGTVSASGIDDASSSGATVRIPTIDEVQDLRVSRRLAALDAAYEMKTVYVSSTFLP